MDKIMHLPCMQDVAATEQTQKSKYNQEQDIKMRCNHCKKQREQELIL